MTFWWLAMTFIDLNFLQRIINVINVHNLDIGVYRHAVKCVNLAFLVLRSLLEESQLSRDSTEAELCCLCGVTGAESDGVSNGAGVLSKARLIGQANWQEQGRHIRQQWRSGSMLSIHNSRSNSTVMSSDRQFAYIVCMKLSWGANCVRGSRCHGLGSDKHQMCRCESAGSSIKLEHMVRERLNLILWICCLFLLYLRSWTQGGSFYCTWTWGERVGDDGLMTNVSQATLCGLHHQHLHPHHYHQWYLEHGCIPGAPHHHNCQWVCLTCTPHAGSAALRWLAAVGWERFPCACCYHGVWDARGGGRDCANMMRVCTKSVHVLYVMNGTWGDWLSDWGFCCTWTWGSGHIENLKPKMWAETPPYKNQRLRRWRPKDKPASCMRTAFPSQHQTSWGFLAMPAHHYSDLIAMIVNSSTFSSLSKASIKNIIEKVNSYFFLPHTLTEVH